MDLQQENEIRKAIKQIINERFSNPFKKSNATHETGEDDQYGEALISFIEKNADNPELVKITPGVPGEKIIGLFLGGGWKYLDDEDGSLRGDGGYQNFDFGNKIMKYLKDTIHSIYNKSFNLQSITESKNEKEFKSLANNFDSIKPPKTTYNIKDRLDYYKKRKSESSDLSESELEKIRVDFAGKVLDSYKIFEVNGDYIRTKVDIDFVSGGNPARYAYIPDGEIWIDENLHPNDFAATVIHEFSECTIMKYKGKSYDHAHDKASAIELSFRKKHLKEEGKTVKIELEKANKLLKSFLKK